MSTLKVLVLSINVYSIILLSSFLITLSKEKAAANRILNQLIYFSVIWFTQSLIFYWILLIPIDDEEFTAVIARIIVVLPILTAAILFLFRRIRFNYKKFGTVLSVFILFELYFKIEQNSWDDLAYHVPIELMIRDSGSLWNWPDIIYAQWGLIGGDVSNSLYAIAFNEFQFDRLNSLLAFIILILLALSFNSLQAKAIAIIMFLSVPAILQQVGSRYVDALLAWALLIVFILVWNQKKGIPHSRLNRFLIFVSMAFSLSIKYSAIIPILLLLIYLFYKTHSKIAQVITVTSGAFLTAVGPIWIRNQVTHDNFLFPYYLIDESAGYMRLSSESEIKTVIYKNSIGIPNQSDFIVFIYQYFVSPIETNFLLVKQALLTTDLDFQEVYFKVFTYDNRLGGFGPALIILMLLIVSKYGFKSIPIVLITLSITSQIPIIIHPRYHLIIFIILVFIAVKGYEKNLTNKYLSLFLVGIMSMVTLFAVANINEYFKRISAPFNFSQGAQIINPDCLDVIKLGSDIWFGANLWGPSYCGKVLYGSFVYNREIRLNALGTGIEVPKLPNLGVNEIADIRNYIEFNESTLVVCVSPPLEINTVRNLDILDPCERLVRNLDQKVYEVIVGPIFEETLNGPVLQTVTIDKVSKI